MLRKEEKDYEMFCQLAETQLLGKGRQIPSTPAALPALPFGLWKQL